jgi:hypothetical protein
MAKGIFSGKTGLSFDRRTRIGKQTSGGTLNAMGVAGKGSVAKRKTK